MLITYPLRFTADNIRRKFNMPSAPFLLNYSVTFRCNLNCSHCGVSKMKNNHSSEELSSPDIARFLKDKKLKKLDVVIITGGEPFLKKDLVNIMVEFKKNISPSIFHITTNGYLTDEIVRSVKYLKSKGFNLDIKISIDDIGSRHDNLRGRKGVFDQAVKTIEALRNAFGEKELYIAINQTIFEENHKSVPDIKKLAASLRVDYMGFVGLKSRPLYSGVKDDDFGLSDLSHRSKDFLAEELSKNVFKGFRYRGVSDIIEKLVMRHYLSGQTMILHKNKTVKRRCMNLFTHFRLNPNGDMITCSYDLDVLGNIKNEKYSDIIKKPVTQDKLRKVKACGRCWLGCEVTPSWVSSLCLG